MIYDAGGKGGESMGETFLKQEKLALSYSFIFDPGELAEIDKLCSKDIGQVQCWRFFRLDQLLYEGEAPQREALQNVISAISTPGFNFIYIIRGDRQGTHIYIGVATVPGTKEEAGIGDFAVDVLNPSFQGMFRGSHLTDLKSGEIKAEIIDKGKKMPFVSMVMGIPSLADERHQKAGKLDFQGIDRLASAMHGEVWQMVIVCEPINRYEIFQMRDDIYALYEQLALLAKSSVQGSKSEGENSGYSEGHGKSITEGQNTGISCTTTKGTNDSVSFSESKSSNQSFNTGESSSASHTNGSNHNISENMGENSSNTHSESQSSTRSKGKSASKNTSSGSNSSENTGKNSSEGSSNSSTTGKSDSTTHSVSKTQGKSSSDTQGKTQTKGSSETKGHTSSSQKGHGTNESMSESKNEGNSHAEAVSENYGSNVGTNKGKSLTAIVELVRKRETEQLQYIDDFLLPRLQKGSSRGMFKTAVYLFAKDLSVSRRLGNNVRAIFQSFRSNFSPLTILTLKENANWMNDFQIHSVQALDTNRQAAFYGVPNHNGRLELASYLTTDEVSIMAGLPQQEIPGLSLRAYTAFGLNMDIISSTIDSFELGHLLYGGQMLRDNPVSIDREELNKHVFVTGITGSGKTMTCKQLLVSSRMKFLVIEPAKTEYKELLLVSGMDDVVVFTIGNERGLPLRFNPFELLPGECLTSHIDMVKAAFVSSFEFEASMPQIFEMALYQVYASKGWDTDTGEYVGSFDGEQEWPNLTDFLHELDLAVEKQHFGKELEGNYRGSLVSRIANLTYGSKGKMLNCRKSVDIQQLLHQRVILEMEDLKSPQDKSLIMALIMGRLSEAVKLEYQKNPRFRHITLVEEAHRLLSKVIPGDGEGKKYAVGIFTDMLAEIRKYGETLIIVDQIPNKLAEDVLKNTATKIVHKLLARDDKELIGDTMMLDDAQKMFLSNLSPGQAVIFTENGEKAVHVQVNDIRKIQSKEELGIMQDRMQKDFIEKNITVYFPELPAKSSLVDWQAYQATYKKNPQVFKAVRLLLGNWKGCNDGLRKRAYDCLPKYEDVNKNVLEILARKFLQQASNPMDVKEEDQVEMEKIIADLLKRDTVFMEKNHREMLRIYWRLYQDFFKDKDVEKCLD